MDPKESKVFLKNLVGFAVLWWCLARLVFQNSPESIHAFAEAYAATLLDLGFLILLFWKVFFTPAGSRFRGVQLFISFTFKLVCLGFLAITLKRLRNDPPLPVVMAVLFVAIGPLASAVVSRRRLKLEKGKE